MQNFHLRSKTYKVKIVKHDFNSNHIEYVLKLIGAHQSFHIQDRYRSMRSMNSRLKEIYSYPEEVPNFPPKKWLGNMKEDFIKARKAGLEMYFNALLKNERIVGMKEVKEYFLEHLKTELGTTIHKEEEQKGQGGREDAKQAGQMRQVNKRPYEESKERGPGYEGGGAANVSDHEKCALIVNTIEEKMLGMNYAGGIDESSENLNKNYTRYIQAIDRIGKTMKFESTLVGLPSQFQVCTPFERETQPKLEKRLQTYQFLSKKIEQISQGLEMRGKLDGHVKLISKITGQ